MQLLNLIYKSIALLIWAIIGIGASIGAVHHLDCPYLSFFGFCGVLNLAIQGYFIAKNTIKLIADIKSYKANK